MNMDLNNGAFSPKPDIESSSHLDSTFPNNSSGSIRKSSTVDERIMELSPKKMLTTEDKLKEFFGKKEFIQITHSTEGVQFVRLDDLANLGIPISVMRSIEKMGAEKVRETLDEYQKLFNELEETGIPIGLLQHASKEGQLNELAQSHVAFRKSMDRTDSLVTRMLTSLGTLITHKVTTVSTVIEMLNTDRFKDAKIQDTIARVGLDFLRVKDREKKYEEMRVDIPEENGQPAGDETSQAQVRNDNASDSLKNEHLYEFHSRDFPESTNRRLDPQTPQTNRSDETNEASLMQNSILNDFYKRPRFEIPVSQVTLEYPTPPESPRIPAAASASSPQPAAETYDYTFDEKNKQVFIHTDFLQAGTFKTVHNTFGLHDLTDVVGAAIEQSPLLPTSELVLKEVDAEQSMLKLFQKKRIPNIMPPYFATVEKTSDKGVKSVVLMQKKMAGSAKELIGLPLHHTINVFGGVSKGLAGMHRAGYVHSDIKLDNILLDGDLSHPTQSLKGYVHDFGLTSKVGERAFKGSIAFKPPEYFSASSNDPYLRVANTISPKDDSFSLGVMIWQSVTGTYYVNKDEGTLFKDLDESALKTAIADEKVKIAAAPGDAFDIQIQKDLLDIAEKLLHPNREKRADCQVASELFDALSKKYAVVEQEG